MQFQYLMIITLLVVGYCQHPFVDENRRMLNWLKPKLHSISAPPRHSNGTVTGLQIALDLEVSTDSNTSRCIPSNRPYCYPLDLSLSADSECVSGGQHEPCEEVQCAYDNTDSLKEHEISFEFVDYSTSRSTIINSSDICGLSVNRNNLIFNGDINAENEFACDAMLEPVLPSIVLNINNSVEAYTIFFDVSLDEEHVGSNRVKFLHVAGFSSESEKLTEAIFYVQQGKVEISVDNYIRKDYKDGLTGTGKVSLVVTGNGLAALLDGEIRTVVERSTPLTAVAEVVVTFGGHRFSGSINNVQVYDIAASTREIYSHTYSESLANNVLEPQCECPPQYGDSFNLLSRSGGKQTSDSLCSSIFSSAPLTTARYLGSSQGKWAMFTEKGWMSDFTDQAEISFNFYQPFFVYGISGAFPVYGLMVKRPRSMEVRINSSEGVEGISVYVSNNCFKEYNLTRHPRPMLLKIGSDGDQRKRRIAGRVETKCFHWSDILALPERKVNGEVSKAHWTIPFIFPYEMNEFLNDAFVGNVNLKLLGHKNGRVDLNENWYSISHMQFHLNAHCDYYNKKLYGPPSNMKDYYNFWKKGVRSFDCICPPGLSGDRCGSCVDHRNDRYMKRPGVCADCDCSTLSISTRCDETGQCDCGPDVDVTLAGKQCLWYVNDVYPLYGPVDGGTTVSFTGPYLDKGTIEVTIFFDFHKVYSDIGKVIKFNTTAKRSNSSYAKIEFSVRQFGRERPANAIANQRPRTIRFEYHPNPVIQSIGPRSIILSENFTLTVEGKYLDSVAAPKMVVNVQQQNTLKRKHTLDCNVCGGHQMECPLASFLTKEKESTKVSKHNLPGGESPLNKLEFTLGFIFDGHDRYRDMYTSPEPQIQNLSVLHVYPDPVVTTFKTILDTDILELQPNSQLTLSGLYLDHVLTVDDYQVIIGFNNSCEIDFLNATTLTCTPLRANPADFVLREGRNVLRVKVFAGSLIFPIGYIEYINNNSQDSDGSFWSDSTVPAIAISSGVVSCVGVIGFVVYWVRRKRKSASKVDDVVTEDIQLSDYLQAAHELKFFGQKLDSNVQANVERCRIPAEYVHLGVQIGKGHFGLVYKARLQAPDGRSMTVAAKTLNGSTRVGFEQTENFLEEATLMINFKHPNVLSLIGVVIDEGELPLAILPYMENGDLCSFIKRDDVNLKLVDLLHFGLQIAKGMTYLAKERFVHRDLAARNCMVSADYIIKVADFGLSKDIYQLDYYRTETVNKPLPVKWMAFEALKEGRFSSKSDVWSYGVTLWELLTRGGKPYSGVDNSNIKDHVVSGKRLDKPSFCPLQIFQMMEKCWEESPEDRPTFPDIANTIVEVLKDQGHDDNINRVTSSAYHEYIDRNVGHDTEEHISSSTVLSDIKDLGQTSPNTYDSC